MARFIILFGTYTAAVIVACMASAAVFFPGAIFTFALTGLGIDGRFITFISYLLLPIMGFCGVFSGSFCLERTSRRFGSIVLLVLGLAYYVHWMIFLKYREGESDAHSYLWVVGLVALAVGGLAAVAFVFRRTASTPVRNGNT